MNYVGIKNEIKINICVFLIFLLMYFFLVLVVFYLVEVEKVLK